jgi:signal-transduction protein with cAMP-binding, CBS, and nucleotidyltransferase domain
LTVEHFITVDLAAMMMKTNQVGCLVVVSGSGELVGILSERDIVWHVVAGVHDPEKTPVGQIMTREVITCPIGTPPMKALELMSHNNIRHLPIVDRGKPVGMISIRDLLAKELAKACETIRMQVELIHTLEKEHPGISRVHRDESGRLQL